MINIVRRPAGYFLIMVLLLLGAACKSSTNNSPSNRTEIKQIVTSIPKAVVTTIIPSPMVPFHFESACWPIKRLTEGNKIGGSLIFSNKNGAPFYWDINTFRAKTFKSNSGVGPGDSFISFDGNFLTYFASKNKLASITQDQTIYTDLPIGDYFIDEPLLNSQLLLVPSGNREIDSKNFKEGVGFTDLFYIYSQKTGELTARSVFLPKFTPNEYGYFTISYSPDMRYVVFHSSLPEPGKSTGFTLMDVENQEIKWTLQESGKSSGGGDIDLPTWKPDSSLLTYDWFSDSENKDLNMYTIALDKTITKFTDLEQMFGHEYSIFSQFKWSNDMRYLIFKAEGKSLQGAQLVIWDDKEKTLLRPCLPVDANTSPLYPFWGSNVNGYGEASLPFIKGTPSFSDTPPSYGYRDLILDIPNRTILELPDMNERGEYSTLDRMGNYRISGWVNWEIP